MRVLHPAHIEVSCPQCKAVLAVEESDVAQDDCGAAPAFSCKCAECGDRIILKREQIPQRWVRE